MGGGSGEDHSSAGVADVLSHPLRRRLVEYLLRSRGHERGMILVANEASRLAAEIGYDSVDEITVDAIRIHLQESHLPALERTGIVTYDAEEEMLALADSPTAIRSYLERTTEDAP